MQRIDCRDKRLLGYRPARRIGAIQHRGADLRIGEICRLRECSDMHAPFILASGQRAGAVDHDLAFAQGQRTAIQQAAGAEFLPGPRVGGDDAEQRQRRRTAHDAVELLLDFVRVRRLQLGDTRRHP